MDHDSDNFIAEELLKTIGAEVGEGGTTAAGAAIVMRDLASAGIPLAGVRIVDGSGLSLDDRLTARAIALLLTIAWNDPDLRRPSGPHCPSQESAGRSRIGCSARRRAAQVRAKTGTTDSASALSGYVRDRFVFAVLQNGAPGRRPRRARRRTGSRPRLRQRPDAGRPSSALSSSVSRAARDTCLLGLRDLRSRALADKHRGRLLRDVVGDLRAESFERRARFFA